MAFYKFTNMAGRWRTWNLECLEETLVCRQHENEFEPLIVDGCTREIPCLDFGSIVLPKEAFFASNEDGSVRSKGRGRSLANRALGLDKPSRRPGQRATSDKAGPTLENAEPKTIGSQFLGSGYLYEELFASLDQSSTKKSDLKSSIPTTSVWGSRKKTKKEKHLSPRVAEQAKNKESVFGEKSTKDKFKSEHSDVLQNSINNKHQKKLTSLENFEDISEEWDAGDIGRSSSDEIISPSLTIYDPAPAVTIDKNKTEVPGKSNGTPRSDLRKGLDISKGSDIITEISDTNSWKIDSKFNMVEFETVQSLSLETINSRDCITTKASEELHKDKQSEHLPKKLEIDNHQDSNPEDDLQEICWIEGENDNKLFAQCNNDKVINICDQLSDHLQGKDQNSTSLKDNVQETDWIESEDNLFKKWDHDEDKNSNHLSDQDNQNPTDSSLNTDSLESDNSNQPLQQYDNEVNTCDPLPASSTMETLEVLDSNEQLLNNSNLFAQQDGEVNHFLPVEDTSTIIATSQNNSLSQSSLEGPRCRKTTDTKETLEETLSLDMSTSDVEMEPCNVLLENLPLAYTEEELREIVEPYGEMESYNFHRKDDLNKTCTIRMPNSSSGELLVVSLDCLEVHGYRIKATMEDI